MDADAKRPGEGCRLNPDADKGEVKNWENLADTFYRWPLTPAAGR